MGKNLLELGVKSWTARPVNILPQFLYALIVGRLARYK